MIGQSFVRSADDVRELRRRLPSDGPLIVAKIETQSAVADFDAIAEVADGVMVARGDLGVDLPFADVPLIQKDLIRRARRLGRFTIVATQMLESMTAAPRPTRAEASDVANAVLDGADALMLSGETAIGTYPVAAAQAMLDIVSATERDHSPAGATPETVDAAARTGIGEAQRAVVAGAASMLAANTAIAAAWCFTRTGRTAQLLADQHPRQPVVAFTISPIVARRLAVRRGVLPIVLSGTRAGEPLIAQMAAAARAHGALGKPTEAALVLLVTTSTAPDGINRLELQRV
jgi:pyruvate kinase